MRILLIEDDPMIGTASRKHCGISNVGRLGYRRPRRGRGAGPPTNTRLVLLNLGLPGKQGLQLLKAIRTAGSRVPIIIITARDELDGRVASLDQGADDYLAQAVCRSRAGCSDECVRDDRAGWRNPSWKRAI